MCPSLLDPFVPPADPEVTASLVFVNPRVGRYELRATADGVLRQERLPIKLGHLEGHVLLTSPPEVTTGYEGTTVRMELRLIFPDLELSDVLKLAGFDVSRS